MKNLVTVSTVSVGNRFDPRKYYHNKRIASERTYRLHLQALKARANCTDISNNGLLMPNASSRLYLSLLTPFFRRDIYRCIIKPTAAAAAAAKTHGSNINRERSHHVDGVIRQQRPALCMGRQVPES